MDDKAGPAVVVVALLAILAAVIAVTIGYPRGTDAAAVLSAATGVIGTVVGAYFGVRAGRAASEGATQQAKDSLGDALRRLTEAEATKDDLQAKVARLAARVGPRETDRILSGPGGPTEDSGPQDSALIDALLALLRATDLDAINPGVRLELTETGSGEAGDGYEAEWRPIE